MWILNQDKTVIVNVNWAVRITAECVWNRDVDCNRICHRIYARFPDGNSEVLGEYTTYTEAKAELLRIFENFDGEYYIMGGAENND